MKPALFSSRFTTQDSRLLLVTVYGSRFTAFMSLPGIHLVTGGAGFIGSHVAAALAASGASVRVLDDLSTGYAENLEEIGGRVDFVRGSVSDPGALARPLEGVAIVLHAAAIPSAQR